MDMEDEDTIMHSATNHKSQFTQSLMLFVSASPPLSTRLLTTIIQSQTQTGARYTPYLTRFYAALGPGLLTGLIQEALEAMKVKTKPLPPSATNDGGSELHRIRIGGYDRRRQLFKGWVEVERFTYRGAEGSFCVMRRDEGNPISWRQLWRAVIESQLVEPHVLKK